MLKSPNFWDLTYPEEAKEGMILTFFLNLDAFNGLSCLYLSYFKSCFQNSFIKKQQHPLSYYRIIFKEKFHDAKLATET